MRRGVALWAAVLCLGAEGAGGSPVPQAAEPWIGPAGITETVDQIMARGESPASASTKPVHRVDRSGLPRGGGDSTTPSWPPESSATAALSGPLNPQTVTTNIAGPRLADSGFIPPDSMGAAGPTQFLFCVNGRIRVTDKTGVTGGLDTTTDNFFSSVRSAGTSDPKVRFDFLTQRWFVVMIDVAATNNRILIAVSSGATITSAASFTFFQFQQNLVGTTPNVDDNLFADYPSLGIDVNALYIGCNMFNAADVFKGSTVWIVRKSSVTGGGPIVVSAFRNLIPGGAGSGPYTPWGVDNDNPAATVGYFIATDAASFGKLFLLRISSPGGVPSLASVSFLTPLSTSSPLNVPALGSTQLLAANDDRPLCGVVRGTSLWTAQNIGVDSTGSASGFATRTASRWYEITNLGATPSVAQSGTLFDSAGGNPNSYWMPSVMVSGQGHMALGCSVAGNTRRAEIAVAGRLVGDAPGSIQAPTTAQTSSSNYNVGAAPYRWGDYSNTCLDPTDNMTMWTVQQYCDANNSWRVRGIKLLAPPPATPISATPSSADLGLIGPVVVNIVGSSVAGSGFYEPGVSFPNHIAATISNVPGAVTVTYTDPTHIALSFSTVGATVGPSTITITNPDGQSVVFSGGFSITDGSLPPQVTGVTSTAPDGTYGVAAILPIIVSFSKVVTVNTAGGTPFITLANGGAGTNAPYTSGSGSANLVFTYTVGGTDNSPDLDYVSTNSLNANGGTITGGSPANLTLPVPGGVNSLSANKNLVIDTTPPDTSITSNPPDPTGSTSASFTFSSTEPSSTFEVELDGAGFVANGSTTSRSYVGLAAGAHTFKVRATDGVGNVDPTPASYTWTIDLTPPDTTITVNPPATTFSGTAAFTYTSTEPGSTFSYQLDGGSWTPTGLTGNVTLTNLTLGSHTFLVAATDPAGNADPSPASYTWLITLPPSDAPKSGYCGATGLEVLALLGLVVHLRRRAGRGTSSP